MTSSDETRPMNRPIRYIIKAIPDNVETIVAGISLSFPVGTVNWLPPHIKGLPVGWLNMDGALLHAVHYPELFAALGYQYGNSPTIEVDAPVTALENYLRKHAKFLKFKPREKARVPNPDHKPGMFALPSVPSPLYGVFGYEISQQRMLDAWDFAKGARDVEL